MTALRALGDLRRLARRRLRPLADAVRRRRGLLAAGLAAAAVATALPQLAPQPVAGTAVLTAARDLVAGAALEADDVVPVELPAHVLPSGALPAGADVLGLRLAGAVRRGEPLTDVRLLGSGLLGPEHARAGLVAAPVRLADPDGAALLRAGDRVDVLAAPADGGAGTAPLVATDVVVLAVPAGTADLDGALVVLATRPGTAGRLAAAGVSSRLSVVLRPP